MKRIKIPDAVEKISPAAAGSKISRVIEVANKARGQLADLLRTVGILENQARFASADSYATRAGGWKRQLDTVYNEIESNKPEEGKADVAGDVSKASSADMQVEEISRKLLSASRLLDQASDLTEDCVAIGNKIGMKSAALSCSRWTGDIHRMISEMNTLAR